FPYTTLFRSRAALLRENEALRRELLESSASRQRLAALEAENQRLRELLGSSRRVTHDVLVASLLRADFDPFRHRVTLNRGTNDGVHEGMALLDAEGVIRSEEHTSELQSRENRVCRLLLEKKTTT